MAKSGGAWRQSPLDPLTTKPGASPPEAILQPGLGGSLKK